VGFIEVVALPLFTTLVEAVPAAKTQLEAGPYTRPLFSST
jgi:ADP-heptose:LPS heptosyltransferase